ETLGDEHARAAMLGRIAHIDFLQGKVDEASARFEEALAVFEALNDQANVARVRWSLGQIAAAKHDDHTALEQLRASYGLFDEIGDVQGLCEVGLDLGAVLL